MIAHDVWSRLDTFPLGWFTARYGGRRYGVSRSVHADGQSMKLFAEELGGPDRISLNIYAPPAGEPMLKPCEMPLDKVTAFVLGAEVEAGDRDVICRPSPAGEAGVAAPGEGGKTRHRQLSAPARSPMKR